MTDAGFKSPILEDIRAEIWLKLWGNMTFNPISALTHEHLEGICRYPLTNDLARSMMTEAQTIAEKLGVIFRVDIDRRIAGAEKVGKHKTSMLQDLEAGNSLEIDALLGSVIELGRITNTVTPYLSTVFALTKLLNTKVQTSQARLALSMAKTFLFLVPMKYFTRQFWRVFIPIYPLYSLTTIDR